MRALFLFVLLAAVCRPLPGQGVERWPVKTSVPGGTNFSKPATVPLADLLALKDAAGVTHNDPRYQSTRIPAQAGDTFPEGKLVSTTGWIFLVAAESDGDYHIQLSDSATSGDQCLIVEVPNADPKFTATPELRPKFQAVRDLIKTKMLGGQDPSPSGNVMAHPVYVTVTGILFYDDSHVGDPPRGKKGMKAATLWELHPVTAIAFAPKPQQKTGRVVQPGGAFAGVGCGLCARDRHAKIAVNPDGFRQHHELREGLRFVSNRTSPERSRGPTPGMGGGSPFSD